MGTIAEDGFVFTSELMPHLIGVLDEFVHNNQQGELAENQGDYTDLLELLLDLQKEGSELIIDLRSAGDDRNLAEERLFMILEVMNWWIMNNWEVKE